MKIVLISGPVAVGKTAIATALVEAHGFNRIRSGNYLSNLAKRLGKDQSRRGLQDLGDQLDAKTDYRWLIDEVAHPAILSNSELPFWLLDCVRKARQVEHFRSDFGPSIHHIHLFAQDEILRVRYNERIKLGGEYLGNTSYDDATRHPNEIDSRNLIDIADEVIDVEKKTVSEITTQIYERVARGNPCAKSS